MSSAAFGLLIITIVFVFVSRTLLQQKTSKRHPKDALGKTSIFDIQPVRDDFDWKKEEVAQYRVFKDGPYTMKLGLEKCTYSGLLLIDLMYLKLTNTKIKIIENHGSKVMGIDELGIDPMNECYETCINILLKKYPKYFFIDAQDPTKFINQIRNESFPLDPSLFKGTEVIEVLSRNIQEDFFVFLPENPDGTGEHVLRAGVFACSPGVDFRDKISNNLTGIHEPVPYYKDNLQFSMNKFFSRIKVGQCFQRKNWHMQANNNFYDPYVPFSEPKFIDAQSANFDEFSFRYERQTFTRLPKTGAFFATIRTFLTPLSLVRNEGRAMELVGAINGMDDTYGAYRLRHEWGMPAVAFLKGETDGITPSIMSREELKRRFCPM